MAGSANILIKIGADTAGAISGINKVNSALGSKLSGAQKFQQGINRAFVPAIATLGALGAAAFDAAKKASDLAETQNKVGVIFGDAAKDLDAWAKAAPAALGQTEQAALDAAATMATFGKSAGLTGADLTTFSTDLVNLSSDLASFHNADPSETVNALGAALRGESEPMRKFGVLLSDAVLKEEAMALGIYDGTGALTAQQKVLAAQAAIMKQTTDAQGDFARTSDGAANQQRILSATIEQAQTEMGAALLPVLESVVGMLSQFATWARENQGTVKVLAVALGVFAGAIVAVKTAMIAWQVATTVATAAQWLFNTAIVSNPIGAIVMAIAALTAGIIWAWNNVDWFREGVTAAFQWIQKAVKVVADWFMEYVWPLLKKVVDFIVAYYKTLWKAVQIVWKGIQTAVKAVVQWFNTYVKPTIKAVLGVIANVFRTLRQTVANIWSAIKDSAKALVSWFANTLVPIMRAPIDTLAGVFSTLRDRVASVFQSIRDVIYGAWSFIVDKINAIKDAVSGVTGVLGNFNPFGRSAPGVSLFTASGPIAAATNRMNPRADGYTSRAGSGGVPYVININTGIGDPVAIAREVRQVMRASTLRVGV